MELMANLIHRCAHATNRLGRDRLAAARRLS
jgi:hypothetical protein